MQIRIILAAVDTSERAERVLRVAASLAQQFDARLYVHRAIVVPPDFAPAAHVAAADPLPLFLERQAQEELRRLLLLVPESKLAHPLVSAGDPWRAIVDMASRLSANLIVMGSHGHHGIDWVIGTTTGKVSTRAPCHVFVVHDPPLGQSVSADPGRRTP